MSVFSKLIPVPQKVELGEGIYKLTSKTVKTNFDATNDFKYLLGELGLPVASICDCKADFLKMVIGEGCITDATAPDNKEGYTLVLRENGAEITANTKEGIAFGLKTLIKLQELKEEIPQATITDYPNLPFRGVHLCIFNPDDGTEKDDTSFESTMKVVKTAAMTGYNTVCVEFWGMFPNPRREYAYWPKAYTMEQVKALVSFIKDDLYMEAFPCLALAMECAKKGGTACPVMNGANEEAVAMFLRDEIGFYDIYRLVRHAVDTVPFIQNPTLEQILESDRLARACVKEGI